MMDRSEYEDKYGTKLDNDHTKKQKDKIIKKLLKMKTDARLDEDTYTRIYPTAEVIPCSIPHLRYINQLSQSNL